MGLDLTKPHNTKDDIYDFLGDTEFLDLDGSRKPIELGYEWDYKKDPKITPTIINEWMHLNHLLGVKVLRDARKVLTIGGGGTSQTHLYLNDGTQEFYILNPGVWDLKNAQIPKAPIRTTLIRAIAEDLPFSDDCLAAIEIPATLDHLADPDRALSECFRVMDKGGVIGITLGNGLSWYREVVRFLKIKFDDNHDHHHSFHFAARQVEALLASNGFINIETIGSAYLKLPKSMERKLENPYVLKIHNFISNVVLRRVFGDMRGGMFLTYGVKPQG